LASIGKGVSADLHSGHLVADVIRMGKGHTEGFEPRVIEALIEMMVSAGEED
jgi:hypothetical protein